jgi:DNA-binding Xre family transcriptional regulator
MSLNICVSPTLSQRTGNLLPPAPLSCQEDFYLFHKSLELIEIIFIDIRQTCGRLQSRNKTKEASTMEITRNAKLKSILFERGITQKRLAEETGINQAYLSGIIRGYRIPATDQAIKIAEILEVDLGEIFG